MGWWQDFSNAASDTVETVVDVVEDVVETTGDIGADVVETVGSAAEDGLNAVGGLLGQIPVVGGFLDGAAAWLGGIVAGAANVVSAVIKGVFGIAAGVLGGLLKIIAGILLLNGGLIVDGLIDIVSSIAGGLIVLVGTLLSLIQRIFFLQSNERGLTKGEKELLRRVFFNSLSLYPIRLIEGRCGMFGINGRAFTLGNTIYMKNNDPAVVPDILVHECTHVWQYQNLGSRYTMDALGAQAIYGNAAYDWEAELARGHTDWNDFNKEAMAQLIQDVWVLGSLTHGGNTTTGRGCFYDLQAVQAGDETATAAFDYHSTDHTPLATDAAASLRGRFNIRWSRNL